MKRITAINQAIQMAIKQIQRLAKRPLQEPDYNTALALLLPTLLNKSGYFKNVRFGGCFIHQSPIATFNDSSNVQCSCELGDLLAICHKVVDGDDLYNAALVQWKIIKKAVEVLTGKPLNQLSLYKHWPLFSLSSKGGTYDIYPKTVTPGAQYGLIQSYPDFGVFTTIPSTCLKVQGASSYARFLINLMSWQTGRPFEHDSSKANDDWSKLINHLIQSSLSKAFTRKNIGQISAPRASKELLDLLVRTEQQSDEEPSSEDKNDNSISILYIDILE